VRVEWVERLRDVQRFASAEQLRDQLARDRAAALDALARHEPQKDQNRASHA
jgi:FAD synthase